MNLLYSILESVVGSPTSPVEHTLLYASACCCQLLLTFSILYIVSFLAGAGRRLSDD